VSGVIAPGGTFGGTLHASQPAPGLEPLAPPDPSDVPNNHLAYAGQWFFFALTALVIYVLALRRKLSTG
jgi:surfeit locus 1 family protein